MCKFADSDSFPRSEGMKKNRAITDKCFGILFWIGLGLMVTIIVVGFTRGDTNRLTHGVNWKGEVCGETETVKDSKYMMFCGSPTRTDSAPSFPTYVIEGSTVCVPACPTADELTIQCLMPAFHNFTSYRGGEINLNGGKTSNVETLLMTVTQSVTSQKSYPTLAWGGRFCLPNQYSSEDGKKLRNLIVNGPWGLYYRPLVSVGGLKDAWPLFLISAGVSVLLGWFYLSAMQKYGGMIIALSMVFTTLLTLAAGLTFFLAIVFDMNDTTSDYAKFNPIMSIYVGNEAKMYSIITGVILILLTVIFGAMTCASLKHIDESVGLIDASMDCVVRSKGCTMQIFAVIQAGSFMALLAFFGYGLFLVASMGTLGKSEISINARSLDGLQGVWKKEWWETAMLWYYFIFAVFMLEVYAQIGHYVLAYCVACWYFTKGETKTNDNSAAMKKALGKDFGSSVQVRVAGVDANYGNRMGALAGPDGAKYLVVPVGRKGPGLGRNDMVDSAFIKSTPPSILAMGQGALSVLFFHAGSLALGAPIIFILRPFRMVSQCVQGFLFRIADPNQGQAYDEDPHKANIKGCLSLMSAGLDHMFGRYSKTAYTQMVLSGGGEGGWEGYMEASDTSFNFLIKAGGSIAHLYGSLGLYELFGTLCISLFSGWICWIFQQKLDMFNEQDASYYIEDKNASLIACMVISFAISFGFMSAWNQTSDVLLYCVAWNRRQHHEGHEHRVDHHHMIGEVDSYCPQGIRYLIPDHERDSHAEHGLHAHGLGQQGAILAAMEHGAMNGGASNAPDYSKAVANTHIMATKMVYG